MSIHAKSQVLESSLHLKLTLLLDGKIIHLYIHKKCELNLFQGQGKQTIRQEKKGLKRQIPVK